MQRSTKVNRQAPQKGKKKPKSKSKSRGRPDRTVSVPTAFGTIQRGDSFRFVFDRAPAHDDYPEGGLRVSGRLAPVGAYADRVAVNSSGTGPFMSSSGLYGYNQIGISPAAFLNSTYNQGGTGIFNGSAIMSIALYCRDFRFRRLGFNYEASIGSNPGNSVSQSLTVAYEQRASNYGNYESSSLAQSSVLTGNAKRFPIWVPYERVPIIEEMRSSRADKLYRISDGTVATSVGSADLDQTFQGILVACLSGTVAGGSETVTGRFDFDFVLDLYGLHPIIASNKDLLKDRKEAPVAQPPLLRKSEPIESKEALPSLNSQVQQQSAQFQDKKPEAPTVGGKPPVVNLASSVPDVSQMKRWTLI